MSLWNTKQPKTMEGLIKSEITLEHNTPGFWGHFRTHTDTDGEGLKMKDGVGWGGWGGWGVLIASVWTFIYMMISVC